MVKQEFKQLYEGYHDQIYRYFLYRVGRDLDVAEDLTQETFTRAFKSYSRYEDRGYSYYAYLQKIAQNILLDHYRAKKTLPINDEVEQILATEEGFDFLDRAWIRDSLAKSLENLNDSEREVVEFFYHQDLAVKDVARKMKKTENAVKLLLTRVRKKLAKNPALQIHRE